MQARKEPARPGSSQPRGERDFVRPFNRPAEWALRDDRFLQKKPTLFLKRLQQVAESAGIRRVFERISRCEVVGPQSL